MQISGGAIVRPVLARVIGALAARAEFSVERLADTVLLGDAVSAHDADDFFSGRTEIAIKDGDGTLDLAVFEGASSGLLRQPEIDEISKIIQPGNAAGIFVFENSWAAQLTTALRRSGAQLVASGRIPVPAMLAKLDDIDSQD